MSVYVNSQYAMRTGQGRHRRHSDAILRLFLMLTALAVSVSALFSAVAVTHMRAQPHAQPFALALSFLAGVAFIIMFIAAGENRAD